MADGHGRLVAPGRHTRRPGPAGLRRLCVAALIMLVVQYGLGIFLNLYVAVPASDAHAGIFQEIATAPVALTAHALLGLALIGTAVLLVARAVGTGDRRFALLAAAGLTAIGGAFGAGEIFVKNGMATASLAMAILTGAALLCYIAMLALAAVGVRHHLGHGARRVVRAGHRDREQVADGLPVVRGRQVADRTVAAGHPVGGQDLGDVPVRPAVDRRVLPVACRDRHALDLGIRLLRHMPNPRSHVPVPMRTWRHRGISRVRSAPSS